MSDMHKGQVLKKTGFKSWLDVGLTWTGPEDEVVFNPEEIRLKLLDLSRTCYFINNSGVLGAVNKGQIGHKGGSFDIMAVSRPVDYRLLGDSSFLDCYGVDFPYMAGSMAHGISSVEMVTSLGRNKMLASFGAGGLSLDKIEAAIRDIQKADVPYAFNLIHSPAVESLEEKTIELYLKYKVNVIEASAFMKITPALVHYRASGLETDLKGNIIIRNKIIAKVSRREIAEQFLKPAPLELLRYLVEEGKITERQASIAQKVPMADDLTAEADSGGHTDNRPMTCLLPSIIQLRDSVQNIYKYKNPVRVGMAGSIGTPGAALSAFLMGASYIVTGSINQSCIEAGTSVHTKNLVSQAGYADVMMAPSTDMFEAGVKVQLLKKGTFFPMRAEKLYELYKNYNSIDEIPGEERQKIEKQIFRMSLDEIWNETEAFFKVRDPEQIQKAKANPKRKMALIFRWYLGKATHWSTAGEKGREFDYQIWCGPSIGAFNDWIRGSYLADTSHRSVVDVVKHIILGTAYLYRIKNLQMAGISLPEEIKAYYPEREYVDFVDTGCK